MLISFEGIDGSGKSTQVKRFAARLRDANIEAMLLREPGGTKLGERIREILLDPETGDINPAAEALLYAASRAELVSNIIKPALAKGQVILLDRYVDSSLAYQGAGRELGVDCVLDANMLAMQGRMPHITILVDLDPKIAYQRLLAANNKEDRLEQAGIEFFSRVRAAYQDLARRFPERIITVSGNDSPDEVEYRINEAIRPALTKLGINLQSFKVPV